MKISVIEFMDFNVMMSIINFLSDSFKDKQVFGKNIAVVQSYSDKHLGYISPSLSMEIMYRKNRSIAFSDFIYEIDNENDNLEFEGTLLEYRVQLNVYSNTRGEIYKWCSILDDILKNSSSTGIPINTYFDNGSIKESNIGVIEFDYSDDVKNNHFQPNVVSYDFHTIYEIKMVAIQEYKISYPYAELGDIVGSIKDDKQTGTL